MTRRSVLQAALILLASCKPSGQVTDLDGHAVDPFAGNAPVTILVFLATGCPISNRYAPEIQRLADTFAVRGAKTYLVYPSASDTAAAILDSLREHGLSVAVVRDPAHVLVRRASVTVTPEAAVFRGGALAYHGRIDDRQVDFGIARPAATRHDLQEAVQSVLSGVSPRESSTPAIGCSILM
jgi:hypothetical protein